MRLAALLALLAAPAPAQDQPDPRRISPLTGEPRPMFAPTSSDESKLALDRCLDRTLAATPAGEAVEACHAEALAGCEAIMVLYPLAENDCALGVRLAWSGVRHEAGLALYDMVLARARAAGPAAESKARSRLQAISARDEAWRIKGGDACLSGDEAAREACEFDRKMTQAALYLGEVVDLLGDPPLP